jgi:hypothetical protein
MIRYRYRYRLRRSKMQRCRSVVHTMDATSFQHDGFALLAHIPDAAECDTLLAHMAQIGSDSPGTRNLLDFDWCQTLASRLRRHRDIAVLLPSDFVAGFTFDKRNFGGTLRSAEEVHLMALANLHGKYAEVRGTADVLPR